MAYCGPASAIPSCASSPVVGFARLGLGSRELGYRGLGSGFAGHGSGIVGLSSGSGDLIYGSGPGATSAELGTLSGVIPQPINQIPSSEVVIQPPSFMVTIPGAILSATDEPVAVGGYSPCGISGSLSGLSGALGYGMRGAGNLGRLSRIGRRGSIGFRPF